MDTGYLIYFRKIKKKLILNFYLNVICFENEHWARVKINHMPCIWITNNLFKRNKLKIVVITCVLSEGRYIIRFLNLENKKKIDIQCLETSLKPDGQLCLYLDRYTYRLLLCLKKKFELCGCRARHKRQKKK